MELPFGTEGRKATHDFLSLHSSSSAHVVQQDPAPPQGAYLKTHDFLQPLERVGKNQTTREENRGAIPAVEKLPPAVEHILPGGIGTYSICYINQRPAALKPERSLFTNTQPQASSTAAKNDEIEKNSNCSSYPASGFSLMWDESAGKTGKENIAERHPLQGDGQCPPLMKNSRSSSNHNAVNESFSSFSSSQHSTYQKGQCFMDMIASSNNDHDDDEEEEDDEFLIKKESSPHPKGNLSVKVEAKATEQKPNTPRSKHSATEQRRRSKINDRFLKLREVIPNSDQKRDKASFLLEVIEYIQFLQEKVTRYESSYHTWTQEQSKITDWAGINQKNRQIAEGLINQMQGDKTKCSIVFPSKVDEKKPGTDTSNAAPIHPKIASFSKQVSNAEERFCDRDQELNIESGTINFSSIYSQGLLAALTQALRKSGVDLSQASLSVQIKLGKRANAAPSSKEHDIPTGHRGVEDPDEGAVKKLRSW
ncbi:transcription factor BIM1 [Andrographis paniculata]|uniref:transcription factor BIM1 n=1 Tax=Andrographis paniculata TaxID=175694 RepID=UPI0021E8736A|nr:transcription factor BIM1 [Andrographis paniculata]